MLLTGGQIVAESLARQGVPYLVGIPGHGCLALLDAFRGRRDISVLQARHEQAAVHMADGYARVTGRPLAVFTSIGPGAANTVVGLATAYADSMPALVVCGDVHTYMFGRGVLQELERDHWANLAAVFGPVTKRYWQATRPDQLPGVMQRAFQTMLSGRRGPVAVSLPMDVQADAAEVNIAGEVVELGGRPAPDPALVERAARLLLAATRPVIVAGGGVLAAGAADGLLRLAEHLGAPVITTFSGKSAFPEDHPLYAWHAGSKGTTVGNTIASSADVIFAVGMRFADESTSSYRRGVSYAIPPARLIHADIDPGEIGKNYPVEVGIVGDARAVLEAMVEAVRDLSESRRYAETPYFAELQAARRAWFDRLAPLRDSEAVPMTISRFIREMRAAVARDAVVVTSSGHSQAQVLQEFTFGAANTCISATGFSTMGFTLPAALGVRLALPERQVVGVLGDGDFLMTVQELATAVQYDLPVVLCVLNNSGWLSIRDLQLDALGSGHEIATEFTRDGKPYSPDLAGIARDFGAWGERVERPDEVAPALGRALASGRPAVLEVLVSREYPASGGVVAGWWDVPVPAYLRERRERYERQRGEEQLR